MPVLEQAQKSEQAGIQPEAPPPHEINALAALLEQRRYAQVIPLAQAMCQRYPRNVFAYKALSVGYEQIGGRDDALMCMQHAVALAPNDAEAHNNLGYALQNSKRLLEAEAVLNRAVELAPGFVAGYNNLGNLLKELQRFPQAEAAYRRALALKPDHHEVRWNLSILLLIQGRYAEAWPYYESRYGGNLEQVIGNAVYLVGQRWQGQSFVGKSLVIFPEQGLGDYIQFARYAPMLKALGVTCLTLVCDSSLQALLETVPGVDAVITPTTPLPAHDYWTLPLSLPLYFGTTVRTIPAQLPYVRVQEQRHEYWRQRLPAQGFKVGLVWKGSLANLNDATRSLPGLATLAPLWSVPGVQFVSLQKGQGEDEAKSPPLGQPIAHLGADIRDFADTAAIVAQLDLVICVDTAVAHVAGALGKPCWVLLPAFRTDWRWLHNRQDSPWYPGALRLFKQTVLDDWSGPVAQVVAELRSTAMCSGFNPAS